MLGARVGGASLHSPQGKALKGSEEDGVHPSWWAYKHAYPPYTALALE